VQIENPHALIKTASGTKAMIQTKRKK